MELTELEMTRLRLEDGFGTSEDESRVLAEGIDWSADRRLRAEVRSALLPSMFTPYADRVMRRLGEEATTAVGDAIREQSTPSVVGNVMAAIGGGDRLSAGLAEELRSEAGEPAPIWESISAAVGGDSSADIGSLLRAGIETEADFRARGWLTPRRRWAIGGAAAAFAAAAALLLSVGSGSGAVSKLATAAMTPILDAPVEIESLEVGAANLVQVLQFGQDAPTIIFVSDDTEEAQ